MYNSGSTTEIISWQTSRCAKAQIARCAQIATATLRPLTRIANPTFESCLLMAKIATTIRR